MLQALLLIYTLLLSSRSRLISAQWATELGCYNFPPSGEPDGVNVGGQSGGYGCSEYCRTVQLNLYRYGFYATSMGISTCYCSNTAPPNGDYTSCSEDSTYEAYLVSSVFTGGECYSSVQASGFQEFFVNSMDECIGECFSNNWIITEVVPNPSPNPNPDPEYVLRCRCGGSYYQAPYHNEDRIACDNKPDNYRVYQYFNLGPSEIARKKRRMNDEERHDKDSLCPAGLTACNLPTGDEYSYECIDTDTELESCGGCIHGPYNPNSNSGKGAESTKGQDCTAIPGILSSAVTCSSGQCVIYGCDETAGFTLKEGKCVHSDSQ